MCSIDEDYVSPDHKQTTHSSATLCMKCSQPPTVNIRSRDSLCRDCFFAHCVHKFRVSFGKSRLVRDQEHVILAYSGGSSSSAMLHLVEEGKSERAKKKLRFLPCIVYIDESCLLAPQNNYCDMKEIVKVMADSKYNYSVYKLSQVLNSRSCNAILNSQYNSQDEIDALLRNETEYCATDASDAKLQNLFQELKSLTAKQSLLLNLRKKLLHRIAIEQKCTKVLFGDSCTRLAVHMLSDITQGKGAHMSYEMGFADKRLQDIVFVKPMREFSSKEIAMYNALNKVKTVFVQNLSTKAPASSSLERLTEDFVTGLQADFPNTVSTIFRTGEKLDEFNKKSASEGSRCCLCQGPLDTVVGSNSALSATLYSQYLCSNILSPNQKMEALSLVGCGDSCSTEKSEEAPAVQKQSDNRISIEELKSCLCYGCRLIVKDIDDYTKLPSYIMTATEERMHRSQLKESVKNYLLNEDDENRT